MLEVKEMSFGYDGGNQLLNKVSFTLKEKELLLLAGRNGVGKSTLFSLLLGEHKFEGEVFMDGFSLKKMSLQDKADYIAYVGPGLTVFGNYTVSELLAFSFRKGKKSTFNMAQVVEMLAIESLLDKRVKDLSAGQTQIVNIARGLVQNTEVILFDEAGANLDEVNQCFFYELLDSLKGYGKTLLVISHRSLSLTEKADKLLVLGKGDFSFGTPQEVLNSEVYNREFRNQDGFQW